MGMLKYRHLTFNVPDLCKANKQKKSRQKCPDSRCHLPQAEQLSGQVSLPWIQTTNTFISHPRPLLQGKQNKNSGLSYINRKIKRQKRAVENKIFCFECSWLLNNNRKVRFSYLTITYWHPHRLTFLWICWWNSCLCVILLLVYSSNRLQK